MPNSSWLTEDRTADYLSRADSLGRRAEGERTLVELLPDSVTHVVDLGAGHGRLTGVVLEARLDASATLIDISPQMLSTARTSFRRRPRIAYVQGDMARPLPLPPMCDLVVSAFAIHHLDDARKKALYAECADRLASGGLFANLDLVTSPSEHKHREFRRALRDDDWDDPEDKLAPVEAQLAWLRQAGLHDVDCYWKWRGMALLCGWRR